MSLTLYTTSARDGEAVKIAAQIAGVAVTIEEVKTVHNHSVANQSPVLATAESGKIFGASAVLRYIARGSAASGLYGNSYSDTSQVDQWVDFITSTLAPNATAWLTPIKKQKAAEPAVIKAFKASTVSALRAINTHLLTNTFLAGNSVTIADVLLFAVSADLVTTVLAPGVRRPLPNFVRYFNTLVNDPVFAGVAGEIEFAAKEQQAPKPAKKEAKVEAKAVVKVVKKINPLLALPESKMTMDATKKDFFSAQPFNSSFFPSFWDEKYDPAGYCVYTCNYNYNDENEIYWQTQNLLGGYVQRLDGGRKFAFGAMMLSGSDEENKPWALHGGFIFRGPQVPFEVSDGNPQSEYYTWTKVDTSTAEGRATFEELMTSDTVEGRKVLDRRYFK